MGDITNIIGIISTTIVAILGVFQSYQVIKSRAKNLVSWRSVEKGIENLLSQMRKDQYFPDAIFPMGRGGAVVAGLMSNKFYKEKNIPIFMVDRDIIHDHRSRKAEIKTDILDMISPPKSILLIGGVNASGATFEKYSNWLQSKGVEKIRVCVLVESLASKFQADYCYRKIALNPTELKMPWYKGGIIDWQPPSYPNN